MSNATQTVLDAPPPAEANIDPDIEPIGDTAPLLDATDSAETPKPEAGTEAEAETAQEPESGTSEPQEPAKTDAPPTTQAEPEKTDEPAEEPAKTDEPATTEEPAKTDQPAAEDKAATDRQAAIQQFQADYAKLQNALKNGTFDAIDDGAEAIKTLAKGLELLSGELGAVQQQYAQQQQQTAAQRFWADFEAKHPHIGAKQGQQLFQAEVDALSKRGFKGEALRAAATIAWERRIEGMKAAAPAAPKTPIKSPPVSKGGARVTPAAGTTPPAPKPRSVDERIEAGEYGNIADAFL